MNIAIIGAAGRMGRHLVSNVSSTPGMKLTGALEYAESPFLGMDAGTLAGCGETGVKITTDLEEALSSADCIIDFATGDVMKDVRYAASKGCKAVIGTTALGPDAPEEFRKIAKEFHTGIVFASNFSVGVNLLFALSSRAAKLLDGFDIEIVEMHHNKKKDAPSGTAVTLAKTVAEAKGLSYEKDVVHGRNGVVGARTKNEIGMHSLRGGDVVGDHTIIFAADGERFELTHKASSRDTFAKGAIRAAAFLEKAAPGLYDMRDVLGLK